MRLLLSLLFCCALSFAFGQPPQPVKWTWEAKQINETEFDLIYKATIDDGWTIYSQFLPEDADPQPTEFTYEEGAHFALVGKTKESENAKKKYDKVFEMDLTKFSGYANFTQRIKVNDYSKPVVGYLTFMTCDHEKCLAPTDVDFTFSLKNSMTTTSKPKVEEVKEEKVIIEQPKKSEPEPKEQIVKEEPKVEKKTDLNLSSNSNGGAGGNNEDQKTGTLTLSKTDSETNSTVEETTSNGGQAKVATWEVKLEKLSDDEYQVVYRANIIDGWYLYSQFQESEDGPTPTLFTYTEGEHFELNGGAEESDNRKKVYDKVFEMNVQKFSKYAEFTQKIKIKDASKAVEGFVEFQVCDDKQCTMLFDDIYIDAKNNQVFIAEEASKRMSGTDVGDTGDSDTLVSDSTGPKIENGVIDNKRERIAESLIDPAGACGGEVEKNSNWFWTFILGFGGGLIALLTPCVFPMIPLTVSFFTKGSKTYAQGVRNGLIYGASIIVIYVSLGLLITAMFGPEALNLLSTHWLPNLMFFAVFIIFAISFFGYFEITLPSSWTTKTDSMADQGGLLGTFFMAATLALVSFSCTGPIIGTALVEAADDPMGPLVVMLGFSTALALPFGLFAAFPAWLNNLPQSGGWMTSVKVVLGFLELALALKFFSMADYTYNWGILKYELFLGLWVVIGIATVLYLLGYIRFPHDGPIKKITPVRGAFIALFAAATVYVAMGFRYDEVRKSYITPSLLSGLAPPASYNFFLEKPKPDADIKQQYASFSKCANDLDCFKDYYEALDYAKKKNLPLLIDFTGKGCVNCRKTEDNIWSKTPVRNNIKDNFVLASLYVDIRDKLDTELISKVQNKKMRTKGNLWADFQIANFGQNSQPLYVLMSPDEEVLARPVGYMDGWSNWQQYNEYLNCGLQTFDKVKDGQLGMKEE